MKYSVLFISHCRSFRLDQIFDEPCLRSTIAHFLWRLVIHLSSTLSTSQPRRTRTSARIAPIFLRVGLLSRPFSSFLFMFIFLSFLFLFSWLYNGARGCADIRVVSVVHQKLFAISKTRENSVVRPGVPDWSDHIWGRRVLWASLLHVVHQRAVLALIRVEVRLLTTCHAAPVAWVHLLKVIQGLA